MMILALLKGFPNAADEKAMADLLMKGLDVPKGVKVHGTYIVFGAKDIAILYEAPDPVTAAKFLTGNIGNHASIERNLLVPMEEYVKKA